MRKKAKTTPSERRKKSSKSKSPKSKTKKTRCETIKPVKHKTIKKKSRSYSKGLKALSRKERELQKALEEIKVRKRLYRKGFGKREATKQVKQYFHERLIEAKQHGALMEKSLRKSADMLKDYSPRVHVHVNADGTVDGEIVLTRLEDTEVSQDYRAILKSLPKMRGAWLMPEIYYTPELEDFYDESDFLVRQGLVGVEIHSGLSSPTKSQWDKPSGLTKTITARLLSEKFEEEAGIKPTQYVLRLFWAKDGRRP